MWTYWNHSFCAILAVGTAVTAAIADDAIVRAPFPRVIVGRVTDSEGNPLAEALVEWGYFNDEPDQRESVVTDQAGHYRLETNHVGRDFRLGVFYGSFATDRYAAHTAAPGT